MFRRVLNLVSQYNIKNIFLEKSYTKCGGVTIARPLYKKLKLEHVSRSIVWSFVQFAFIAGQVEDYQKILKLSCKLLAFTSYKAFFKKNKRSGTRVPALFSECCLNENFVLFYLPLLREMQDNMYCSCFLTRFWNHEFWN